jgi:hypothetical protein
VGEAAADGGKGHERPLPEAHAKGLGAADGGDHGDGGLGEVGGEGAEGKLHTPTDGETLDDAFAGRAATYDITGELAHAHGVVAPRRTAAAAARAVMAGAREHDLALFELFLTDKAGHAQDTTWARHEIGRTEAFLAALLAECDVERDLVVVTSDHGNLEDLSTRSHTRADVPVLAWGRGAGALVASLGPRPDLAVVGAAVLANARATAAPARAPAP